MVDAHTITITDPLQSDADLGPLPSELSHGAGWEGAAARAELEAKEARLQDYLVYGPGGAAFGSNPTAALSGEDRNWSGGIGGIFSDFYHRRRLAEYLWWLYQVGDPVARNAVRIYTYFLIGGGCKVSFEEEADEERWQDVQRRVQWRRRERQMVEGAVLFGETFALVWPKVGPDIKVHPGHQHAPIPVSPAPPRSRARVGELKLRVLNSFDIDTVETVPGDPETPTGYMQRTRDATYVAHAPDDVVHITLDTIPGNVRGHPLLLPVLQPLYFCRAFLSNRHWLNMVRSRVPLILTRKAGGTQGLAQLRSQYSRLPAPGTVWTLPGGVEAVFPSLNIGAADVSADYKTMLRTVAMGLGLPEFLLTSDASNANYSSSVVAEAPAMQMFRDMQGILGPLLEQVVARLLGRELGDTVGIAVTFPSVERNLLQLVQSLSIAKGDGVVSKRTYAERAGFQWLGTDGEQSRLEAEGGFDDLVPGLPVPGGEDNPAPGAAGAEPGTGRSTPPGMGGASNEDP